MRVRLIFAVFAAAGGISSSIVLIDGCSSGGDDSTGLADTDASTSTFTGAPHPRRERHDAQRRRRRHADVLHSDHRLRPATTPAPRSPAARCTGSAATTSPARPGSSPAAWTASGARVSAIGSAIRRGRTVASSSTASRSTPAAASAIPAIRPASSSSTPPRASTVAPIRASCGTTPASRSSPIFTDAGPSCTGISVSPATNNVVVDSFNPFHATYGSGSTYSINALPSGCYQGTPPALYSISRNDVATMDSTTGAFAVVVGEAEPINRHGVLRRFHRHRHRDRHGQRARYDFRRRLHQREHLLPVLGDHRRPRGHPLPEPEHHVPARPAASTGAVEHGRHRRQRGEDHAALSEHGHADVHVVGRSPTWSRRPRRPSPSWPRSHRPCPPPPASTSRRSSGRRSSRRPRAAERSPWRSSATTAARRTRRCPSPSSSPPGSSREPSITTRTAPTW